MNRGQREVGSHGAPPCGPPPSMALCRNRFRCSREARMDSSLEDGNKWVEMVLTPS
jgi:hypothetical protein